MEHKSVEVISSKYLSTSDFSSLLSRYVALLDFEEFLGMVRRTFSTVVLDVLILFFLGAAIEYFR